MWPTHDDSKSADNETQSLEELQEAIKEEAEPARNHPSTGGRWLHHRGTSERSGVGSPHWFLGISLAGCGEGEGGRRETETLMTQAHCIVTHFSSLYIGHANAQHSSLNKKPVFILLFCVRR